MGYREQIPEEADCITGVDDSGVECCECGVLGSLGISWKHLEKIFCIPTNFATLRLFVPTLSLYWSQLRISFRGEENA